MFRRVPMPWMSRMLHEQLSGTTPSRHRFLEGGGEMGERMRGHDWSTSPLGTPEAWPQSLRTLVHLLLNAKQAMFVVWGPELAFLYNDAYAPIFGDRHPLALGRPFADVWSDIWPQIEPLVVRTLAGEASWYEDLLIPMVRHGYREEAWFTFSYTPVHDDAGTIAGMFCAATETTGKVLAERRLATERERLRELFHQAPGFMCVLQGTDFVFEMANASYLQLVGHRDVVGKPLHAALPEVMDQGFVEVLNSVYTTGEPFVGRGIPIMLQQERDTPPERRYLNFVYQPIRDANGRVSAIFVEGSDITEAKRAEQHQRLLMNELNHRLKNTLASVQAVVSQTLRRSSSIPEAQDKIASRLKALGRAQDVLTSESWDGAEFHATVEGAIAPLLSSGSRVRMAGPCIRLNPRASLSLSLALHELATNAMKYGALKNEEGWIDIEWWVDSGNTQPQLVFKWEERDGPPVAPPTRQGFGTRLIERGLAAELAAEVRTEYAPSGIVFTLKTALAEIQDKTEQES